MAPPRRSGESTVPQATMNSLFEKMGEVQAVAREAKHAANGASQKIDAVAGKVDALAIVVANQGHLQEDVDDLKSTVKEQRTTIEDLVADKHRREGAVGLVEWIGRHWPFPVISALLAAWIAWANGKLHL